MCYSLSEPRRGKFTMCFFPPELLREKMHGAFFQNVPRRGVGFCGVLGRGFCVIPFNCLILQPISTGLKSCLLIINELLYTLIILYGTGLQDF
jgi:hypothetical protein